MKTLQTILLFCLAVAFFSCDPVEGVEGEQNYWSSNTLTRLHLYGKVKTVTLGSMSYNFNEKGYITSQVYNASPSVSTTTYNYDASGKLVSQQFNVTGGESPISYTTTFGYNNAGKFILSQPMHLAFESEASIVPALSSVTSPYQNVQFKFIGSVLHIIQSYTYDNTTFSDTVKVTYSNNYPVAFQMAEGSYAMDIKYRTNGMYKSFVQGWNNAYDNSSSQSNYYFKADDTFLMLDSIVTTNINNGVNTKAKRVYAYDANKNLSSETYSNGDKTTYSYVYDSNRNWTQRTTTTHIAGNTTDTQDVENRVISYW